MRWEMEVEEIDAVMEKIWDLHDKLSDAIHSISRAHFLNSIKSLRNSSSAAANGFFVNHHNSDTNKLGFADSDHNNRRAGFVFVKDFHVDDSTIQEAKSLNAIRTALENLEDQLEFFQTVQTQQRVERDAAIAQLEQSRIVLAMRLGEHQGKKYKVIEEARAFVGDVRDASHFASAMNLFGSSACPVADNSLPREGKGSIFFKVFMSGLNFFKKSTKLDQMGGILGNAALVAASMLALLHLHQVSSKDRYILDLPRRQGDKVHSRNVSTQPEGSTSFGCSAHLDVLSARG